jgi:hypothetical protein
MDYPHLALETFRLAREMLWLMLDSHAKYNYCAKDIMFRCRPTKRHQILLSHTSWNIEIWRDAGSRSDVQQNYCS